MDKRLRFFFTMFSTSDPKLTIILSILISNLRELVVHVSTYASNFFIVFPNVHTIEN
jgi:hypothetical protein